MIYKRILTIGLLLCLLISFTGAEYALAAEQAPQVQFSASGGDSEQKLVKGAALGGLVVLGIWGVSQLIGHYRAEKYQQRLTEGQAALQDGDYGQAIKKIQQAQTVNQTEEAEQLLAEAKNNYQHHHYQLGEQYLAAENWEQAYKEFERVKQYGTYREVEVKYQQAYKKLRELELKRIAVLKFSDSSRRFDLGGKAASLFTAKLLEKDPKFIAVIEREQLTEVLQEQKLQATGLVDSDTAQELGNILGVDYLVVGKVIGGSVTTNEEEEWVDVYYEDEEKKQYIIQKRAYTQIFFKLLEVNSAEVVLSKRVKKEELYEDSYYQGDSALVPSDEEILDRAVEEAVAVFVQDVYDEFEL